MMEIKYWIELDWFDSLHVPPIKFIGYRNSWPISLKLYFYDFCEYVKSWAISWTLILISIDNCLIKVRI